MTVSRKVHGKGLLQAIQLHSPQLLDRSDPHQGPEHRVVDIVKFFAFHPAMFLHAENTWGRSVVRLQEQVQIHMQIPLDIYFHRSGHGARSGTAGYVYWHCLQFACGWLAPHYVGKLHRSATGALHLFGNAVQGAS